MQTTTELKKVTGVVEAVSQRETKYSVRIGKDWYGGYGTCPAEKGAAYVIEYAENGKWKNIKSITEQGAAIGATMEKQLAQIEEARKEEPAPVLVLVKNFRTDLGLWEQVHVTSAEDAIIQQAAREKNNKIFAECLEDADDNVEAAIFLAERRIVHVSRIYDDFLKWKTEKLRRADASGEGRGAPSSEIEEAV